jgi:hypothetical protein
MELGDWKRLVVSKLQQPLAQRYLACYLVPGLDDLQQAIGPMANADCCAV